MRPPPALQVPCVSAPAWRILQAFTMGMTSAALMAWGGSRADADPLMCWSLGLMVGALVTMWAHRLLRVYRGTLRWDGTVWHWHGEAASSEQALGAVDITIDLQLALLLRLKIMPTPPNRHAQSFWLALQRKSLGAQWVPLCATLYATQGRARMSGAKSEPS